MKRVLFLLAAMALAASAEASYGQMRLEGIAFFLVFMMTVGHGLVVDLALYVSLFRFRTAVVIGSIVGPVLAVLYVGLAAASSERESLYKLFSGGSGPLVLLLIGTVFLPFIVAAPVAQHRALREGRLWPAWIGALMAAQLGLLPGFIALAVSDQYFWQREYDEAHALGSATKVGELGALLERADHQKARIWGTGWNYPWPDDGSTGSTGWSLGMALGLDLSAPIAANEPLTPPDSAALRTLLEKHLGRWAAPRTRAKLLWDELEPGSFAELLAPQGVDEGVTVSEEVIPVLLERLEKQGETRLCPGGRMADADRALLKALIAKKGSRWNGDKREYEMDPDWAGYQQRLERICAGGSS